jgi:glutamate synthase domain-containing protein 3
VVRQVQVPVHVQDHCGAIQVRQVDDTLEKHIQAQCKPALDRQQAVTLDIAIRNVHRTLGTRLSSAICRRYGEAGLPDDTITLRCTGSAGQSFMAFGARGVTAVIHGDANDYFGKGLSGARLMIRPPADAGFAAETNVIIGNVAFYGATSGEAFIRGMAGERFCVRNSGVQAVVEGTGDHACEYMTGGRVVILGRTGRNTAAGMSGGVAYVLDEPGDFQQHRCNMQMVDLDPVTDDEDIRELKTMIERHLACTESSVAQRILDRWEAMLPLFVKVMPVEYKRSLSR